MHQASALLFRAADPGGMGGVDAPAPGPSSAAVWGLAPAWIPFAAGCFLPGRLRSRWETENAPRRDAPTFLLRLNPLRLENVFVTRWFSHSNSWRRGLQHLFACQK